ncbi:MAG: chromosomal replication initiator protein DnaA [Christensenellales bacterium]
MSKDLKEFWTKVLQIMETNTNLVSYEVWLQALEPVEIIDGKLIMVSPTDMGLKVVQSKYMKVIADAVAKINPTIREVKLMGTSELTEFLRTHIVPEGGPEAESEVADDAPMFNPKYTFDNFVVGKSNQFVQAAARAVAEKPGTAYNPLFIYGGSGLGKTHLMHAIGNFLRENRSDLRLMYITSERFVNDMVDAIKDGNIKGKDSTKEFRARYRNVDVLMIDDIQFIENKPSTQEEFFHTFNDLHQSGRQIIVSSDRAPKYLADLQERLRSRFQWGLLADIQPPELETRLAILKRKAESERYNVDDRVYEFIASQSVNNIREMEGLLARVTFYASLSGKHTVTYEDALEAIKDYVESRKETLTVDRIVEVVCEYYGVTKTEICGKKKNKEIVDPRQISMYIITDMLPSVPLAAIGQAFGGRDHTTVMHARDKISALVKAGTQYTVAVKDIKDRLVAR